MQRLVLTDEHIIRGHKVVAPRRARSTKSPEDRDVQLLKYHQRRVRELKEKLNGVRT